MGYLWKSGVKVVPWMGYLWNWRQGDRWVIYGTGDKVMDGLLVELETR